MWKDFRFFQHLHMHRKYLISMYVPTNTKSKLTLKFPSIRHRFVVDIFWDGWVVVVVIVVVVCVEAATLFVVCMLLAVYFIFQSRRRFYTPPRALVEDDESI